MKQILEALFHHQVLTRPEAKQALIKLVMDNDNPTHIAAFITVFLMRKITLNELAGFADALKEVGTKVNLSDFDPMDVCGTGGDNKNTFNISSLSALVVAGLGIHVAKHGNYAVSSSCGSSNILEYFKIPFYTNQSDLQQQIDKTGICFLHAPLFQPELTKVGKVRKQLQVKSFFNMLGPLVNPASPHKQLAGVYNMELAEHYSTILPETVTDYSIIHSVDGFDEISLTGPYRLINRYSDTIKDPGAEGFLKVSHQSIFGGTTLKESADIFTDILTGKGTAEQNEVVIANASVAVSCYYPELSRMVAIDKARESLLTGKALKVFKKLTALT